MDLGMFRAWLERYFAAWASNAPGDVAALFSEDAEYSWGPFRAPARGRDDIVRWWTDGGAQPELETSFEPIAVEGDRGVAHFTASFRTPVGALAELDGILVCTFDQAGRCTLHREWYERRETPTT